LPPRGSKSGIAAALAPDQPLRGLPVRFHSPAIGGTRSGLPFCYRPRYVGGRRAIQALRPSCTSAVAAHARELLPFDAARPSAMVVFRPRVTAVMNARGRERRVAQDALGELEGAFQEAACPRGTTLLTRPSSICPLRAENGSPVRSSSRARLRPARRGRRWVPPKVGGMPILISGFANSAVSATRPPGAPPR
jgi:hypothetical protein